MSQQQWSCVQTTVIAHVIIHWPATSMLSLVALLWKHRPVRSLHCMGQRRIHQMCSLEKEVLLADPPMLIKTTLVFYCISKCGSLILITNGYDITFYCHIKCNSENRLWFVPPLLPSSMLEMKGLFPSILKGPFFFHVPLGLKIAWKDGLYVGDGLILVRQYFAFNL